MDVVILFNMKCSLIHSVLHCSFSVIVPKRQLKFEWDGNGFWLHTKKLIGKDRFRWPKSREEASMLIDKRQLSWLLDGLDINQKYAHHKVEAVV